LSVQGLSSARNFFVCGHKMGQPTAQAIAITISVNGIQQQTFTLGDASKAVVVTQLVLDDGVVAVPVGHL
jgi:hypothetical protein